MLDKTLLELSKAVVDEPANRDALCQLADLLIDASPEDRLEMIERWTSIARELADYRAMRGCDLEQNAAGFREKLEINLDNEAARALGATAYVAGAARTRAAMRIAQAVEKDRWYAIRISFEENPEAASGLFQRTIHLTTLLRPLDGGAIRGAPNA